MKKTIYLLAVIVSVFTLGLYIPRFTAYAQDKAEQRKINQQILDLELELEDIQSQRWILNDDKDEKTNKIQQLSWQVAEIENTQNEIHNKADEIRKQISLLKWDKDLNEEVVNCYQWTWELYNECLDAIIQVGLMKSRQAQ